jgi:hypothetical protein
MVTSAAAQEARLPAQNLRIEWRWVESSTALQDVAGAAGSVTLSSAGQVSAQGQVTLRSDSRAGQAPVRHQVLVLNGAPTQLRLSSLAPLEWVEAVQGPRGQAGVLRQQWVEVNTSVRVLPRWPGGRAPVDLEIEAERALTADASNPGAAPVPSIERVATRVQVPLGDWSTVATSAVPGPAPARGTLSTADIERRALRELQLRVSLP